MSTSGILTACSRTPGTGFVVHRGTGVNPLISHLPRRVAAPARAWRDIFSLFEEGVGSEHCALTHHHVVVDEGAYPDRAASADRGWAGLERAVLLRLALDDALRIENTLVPDGGQGWLGDVDAVLEDFEGGQVDEYDQEDAQPPREQEDADRPEVESVLCGKAEAQRLPRPEMVESAVRISFSNAMPHVSGGHLRGFAECGDVT